MESFNIEGRGFSLTSDRTKSFRTHQGMELSAGPHPLKIIPKNVHKGNLFQQAYDGKRSTFLVCSGDEAREIIPSSNKRKASACNFTDRYRKSSERNSFVCARSGSLHSCMQTPTINCPSTGTTNDVKRNTPPLPQYLTYHLERFPSQQERDALTERKRVALLKVLAQQLITRLNASESHPSYLHDPNVQAHAYSLRSNLEKFQRDLHAAIKVLGACHSQSPKNKNSSYIVLPKVPERRGIFRTRSNPATESQRGVDAPELEDTSNKQPRVLCGDIRIERKSSPDSIDLANSVLSKTREEVAVSSEQKSTTLHGETTEEIKEVKKSTCTFQDLESRLLSFCPDSKSRGMYKERHTWDNQLLDKELEKLEAEIKETKLRMARNLLLTHRVADTTSQTSPMSISPRCSAIGTAHVGSLVGGNANTASDIERSSDMPILSDDPESVKYVHGLESETIDGPSDEKLLRQPDGSKTEENVFPLAVKYPTYEVTTVEENCDSDLHKPLTELLSGVSREEGMTISNNIPRDLTTSINGKTESCEAHSHVRSVEVSQRAQEPGTTGRLTVLFKQGFKSNAEVLVNTVMEALMQELLDSEISDMLPQNTDVQCRPNIRDMKKENSEYANLGSAFTVITSNGRERSYSLSDSSTTSDSSGPTSLLLAQEASNACLSERQVSYNDLDEWTCEKYHEPLADSPINASFKVYNDSFKAISKRLVDRYVKEILYIQGLFCASSLLELYASGKTLALVWEKKILDSDDFEEMLYGKLVMEAICECMDHKYQQFYVPSFFLFFQPCPDDRHLERILVKTVNEHADAACEGGFSLEYILHKSLDEEDWGTAHYELVELIHGLSEHVMGDLIDDCVSDLIGFKTKRTRLFNVNVSNVDPTAQ
ncbi:hypothetical protein KP509_13G009500 [Ceratopteris richardii]|nr:hypothetical protein KP509_13G009500 [Ceratopteris richardii]